MQVINTTSNGATVELSASELSLLANIGIEVFGGSFNVKDDQWQSVPMPMTRAEAKDMMLKFVSIHASTKKI